MDNNINPTHPGIASECEAHGAKMLMLTASLVGIFNDYQTALLLWRVAHKSERQNIIWAYHRFGLDFPELN